MDVESLLYLNLKNVVPSFGSNLKIKGYAI